MAAQSIHAFIICWTGMEDKARHIASAITPHVERLTVIYSNKNGTTQTGQGDWVKVPDAWFYGKKFKECLRLHNGDIMLQIQADAGSGDWPQIIRRCKSAYAHYPSAGIWAPDVDWTPWHIDQVNIGYLENSQFALVVQTDGIVWSMSAPIVTRMRNFDYECNNFGWGIDWVAISYAASHNLLVLRDMSVKIAHPQGRGYSQELAHQQKLTFLAQMSVQEKAQFELLNAFIVLKARNSRKDQNRP